MALRTAPQINHLRDLEQFIKIIAFEKIPYTSIEGKNFKQLADNTYQEVLRWKNENGFSDAAGYFQEFSALLNIIGITKKESLNDDDLEDNFSTTNIVMKEITNGRKNSVLTLTEIGFKIFKLLDSKTSENLLEYKILLFWLILRSNIRPVWQRLIQNPGIFSTTPVEDAIRNIGERDGPTRTFFLNASNYFELFNINTLINTGKVFDRLKFSQLLFYSSILEINQSFTRDKMYTVEEIVLTLENTLHIPQSVNFLNILNTIFEIDRKQSEPKIEGSRASRDSIELPGHDGVSMLKFSEEILLFPKYSTINADSLHSFIEL